MENERRGKSFDHRYSGLSLFFAGVLQCTAQAAAQNVEQGAAGGKAEHADPAEGRPEQGQDLSQDRDMAHHDPDESVI